MNPKLKAALFSYLEAGIASVIVLAYTEGAKHPIDFLWAFLAGFAGPIVKAVNPLDAAFGLKPLPVPETPHGTAQQEAVADAVAKAVTGEVAAAADPVLNKVAQLAAPTVSAVEAIIDPVLQSVEKPVN